jgi:hypothetical protein
MESAARVAIPPERMLASVRETLQTHTSETTSAHAMKCCGSSRATGRSLLGEEVERLAGVVAGMRGREMGEDAEGAAPR